VIILSISSPRPLYISVSSSQQSKLQLDTLLFDFESKETWIRLARENGVDVVEFVGVIRSFRGEKCRL
jgi:hypothetical protein